MGIVCWVLVCVFNERTSPFRNAAATKRKKKLRGEVGGRGGLVGGRGCWWGMGGLRAEGGGWKAPGENAPRLTACDSTPLPPPGGAGIHFPIIKGWWGPDSLFSLSSFQEQRNGIQRVQRLPPVHIHPWPPQGVTTNAKVCRASQLTVLCACNTNGSLFSC